MTNILLKTETQNKLNTSFQRTTSLQMKSNNLSHEIEEIKALSLVTKRKNCDIFNSNVDNTSKHSLSEKNENCSRKQQRSDSAITLVDPNILSPCSAVTTSSVYVMAEIAEMAEMAQIASMLLNIEDATMDERYVEKAEIIEKIKTVEVDDFNDSSKMKSNSSISSPYDPSFTSKHMLTIDASGKDKICSRKQRRSDSAITLVGPNILSPCSAITTSSTSEKAEIAEIAQIASMDKNEKAEIIEKIKTYALNDSSQRKSSSNNSSTHYPSLTSKRMLTIDASEKGKNCTKTQQGSGSATLADLNIPSPLCSAMIISCISEMAEKAEIEEKAETVEDTEIVEKAEIAEERKISEEMEIADEMEKAEKNEIAEETEIALKAVDSIVTQSSSTLASQCISIISVKRIIHKSKFEYYYTIQLAPSTPMENSLFVTRSYEDFWILHCHLILSSPKSVRTFPFLESPSPSITGSSCTITQALQNRRRISIYLKSLLDYPLPPRGQEILRYFLSPNPKSRHDYSSSIFKSSFITLPKFAPIILMDASKTTHPLDLRIDTPSLEYLYLEASEKIDENISSLYFRDEFGDIVELGSGALLSQLRLTLDEVILFSSAPI